MGWILAGLALLNAFGVWMLLMESAHAVSPGWVLAQSGIAAVWAGLFGWGAIRPKQGRAVWLIGGFILYGVCRLVLFAQSDYDRQRWPFLAGVVGTVLCVMILAWRVQASRGADQK